MFARQHAQLHSRHKMLSNCAVSSVHRYGQQLIDTTAPEPVLRRRALRSPAVSSCGIDVSWSSSPAVWIEFLSTPVRCTVLGAERAGACWRLLSYQGPLVAALYQKIPDTFSPASA